MEKMDAKTFLIQQHKTGKYDDICQNHDTDYGLPFWSAIVRLLEEYKKYEEPVKEKKCCVCGMDISDTDNSLFCEQHAKPIKMKS